MENDKTEECVWGLETSCKGEVVFRSVLNNMLNVPICNKHYRQHLGITLLADNDYGSIQDILQMSEEEVENTTLILALSGTSDKELAQKVLEFYNQEKTEEKVENE